MRAGDERGETTAQTESREVLDAFFVGKSLAETLLERTPRAFQDEVIGKAREESQRAKRKDDGIR